MSNTEAPRTRCLRCGRTLTAAASIARKVGRGCSAIIRAAALAKAVRDFAEAQVDKAREAIADGALIAIRTGIYQIVSSKGDATYLSHSDACNCPAGLRARRCWHLAAVRILTARKAA